MKNGFKAIVLILHMIMTPASLFAGEKDIKINNKSYTVKTLFGNPIHHRDDYLKIINIKPVFGMLQGWRENRQTWTMHIKFNKKQIFGIISIKSLLNEKDISITPIYIDAREDEIVVQIVEFFSKRDYPSAWDFLNYDGDSWIPFECHVELKNPQISYSFVEFAKITKKYKKILKNKNDLQYAAKHEMPIKKIVLSNDCTIEVPFENGAPYRYADAEFQVENLSPAFDQKATNDNDPWIWTISGRMRDIGPCRLEIYDPLSKNARIAVAELNGNGNWYIIFGEKSKNPNLWLWENNNNKYVAIKLKLTLKNTDETKEWYEVCQIDKRLKRLFSEFKK